ncbi:MAG: hypothetical protein ACOC87_04175 [Candidatus Natronoplasma sp.]
MNTKASALVEEFKSIKSQAEEIREEIVTVENPSRKDASIRPGILEQVQSSNLIVRKVKEVRILVKEYNSSISEVSNVIEINLASVVDPTEVSEAKGVLRQIETQCDKAIGGLRPHLSPISAEEQDRLSKYRSKIEDLASELDPKFVKNMNKAIEVFEKGYYLASALISSRMIIYLIEKIPGSNDEEKADFLEREAMIEESDEKSFLIKVNRQARNYFSHDIKSYPDSSDALSLLGDSVKLLRLYLDFKEEIPEK